MRIKGDIAVFRIACAAGAAMLLAGCASATKHWQAEERPQPPDGWSATDDADAPPPGDWVSAFNDAALRQLIDDAMAYNNDVNASYQRLVAARNSARVSRSALMPTIDANLDGRRFAIVGDAATAAQSGGGGGGGTTRVYVNDFELGARAQWEVDLWGRLLDETRAGYADATAAHADFEGRRLSIAGATAQAWFDLIEAHLQRELGERDVETQTRSLNLVERRYARGVSESLDLRLARSALASSEANLASRQRAEAEASRALEVLLGRYPAAELASAPTLPDLHDLPGAGTPVEVLARRPDLVAAERRLEAAGLRARAARKAMLPRITLTANINGSGPDFSDITDPDRLAGNIIGGLLQPLFRGGQLLFEAERQKSLAKAELFDYANTILTAYQEAENALAAERLLAAREAALQVAYEEALAAEQLAVRQYGNGVATIFELLDAQERRINSESQYINATKERLANRVRLYLAIGGEFYAPPASQGDVVAAMAKESVL